MRKPLSEKVKRQYVQMAWDVIREIEEAWRVAHPGEGDGASGMPTLQVADAKEITAQVEHGNPVVLPLVQFGRLHDPGAPWVGAQVTLTLNLNAEQRIRREQVKQLARNALKKVPHAD